MLTQKTNKTSTTFSPIMRWHFHATRRQHPFLKRRGTFWGPHGCADKEKGVSLLIIRD